MFGLPKKPQDPFKHPKAHDSRILNVTEAAGRYAYVVDLQDVIHVVPDGSHVHPTILGNAEEALHAGDLEINPVGTINVVTNSSGTFRFQRKPELCCLAQHLRDLGFTVNKVMLYSQKFAKVIRLKC